MWNSLWYCNKGFISECLVVIRRGLPSTSRNRITKSINAIFQSTLFNVDIISDCPGVITRRWLPYASKNKTFNAIFQSLGMFHGTLRPVALPWPLPTALALSATVKLLPLISITRVLPRTLAPRRLPLSPLEFVPSLFR